MLKITQQHLRMVFVLAMGIMLAVFSVATSDATIVGAQSFGDEMAGGLISVTFAQSGVRTAPIMPGGPGVGTAADPGFFSFSVSGDTFISDWRLTNDTTFDSINTVVFDLSNTTSPGSKEFPGPHTPGILFDDGSFPDTPNGFAGRAGAVQVNVGLPLILGSFESNPWTDPMNLGDEFVEETIRYEGFGPLLTSVWLDDTDIVGIDTGQEMPEPTSGLLLMLGAACLVNRIRRP